jgi:hypothetical protein
MAATAGQAIYMLKKEEKEMWAIKYGKNVEASILEY